jgi:hypothetical protein
VEDEFFVGGGGWEGGAVLFEFAAEVVAAVEADVADEPDAAVDGGWLLWGLRGGAGAQKGEDEGGAGLRGDVVASGPRKASAAAMRSRRSRSGGALSGEMIPA